MLLRLLIPSSFALPPVEYCRGTRPSHAAKSRPLRTDEPLPMAATIAVATIGPMPGICRIRQQAASFVAICSSLSVSSSIYRSTVFHSSRSILIRFGVSELSAFSRTPPIAALNLAGFCANTMPRPNRNARIWLMTDVRRATRRSRIRCIAYRSSWSSVLIGTKRIFLRSTASAIPSASTKSFLLDFTNGFTNWAAISRTS